MQENVIIEDSVSEKTLDINMETELLWCPSSGQGLGMVDGVLRLVPSARVGHIGMFRDEETLEPHVYLLQDAPGDIADRDVMIVDPMLATGGSAEAAITELKKRGCRNIKLMGCCAAPEGIERIQKTPPDVDIYCGCRRRQSQRARLYCPRSGRCRRPHLWDKIRRLPLRV